jgi:RimJ/RimL family protein N-acetyltransferase
VVLRHDHGVNAEIELLFVEPALMGQGVGRALLDEGIVEARRRGRAALWMLSDPDAEPFSQRAGAVRVGLHPSDAIAGRVLPWLRLHVGGAISCLRTARLLLRPWRDEDLAPFAAINSDPRVAQYLPGTLTREDNVASRRVMEKLAMHHEAAGDFDHPSLPAGHPLTRHVLYRLSARSLERGE